MLWSVSCYLKSFFWGKKNLPPPTHPLTPFDFRACRLFILSKTEDRHRRRCRLWGRRRSVAIFCLSIIAFRRLKQRYNLAKESKIKTITIHLEVICFSLLPGARGQAVPTARRRPPPCGGGTRTGSLSAMPVASTTNYTT